MKATICERREKEKQRGKKKERNGQIRTLQTNLERETAAHDMTYVMVVKKQLTCEWWQRPTKKS